MKTIKLKHPEQTCPDLIETVFEKLPTHRLHSQCFLPGAIAGTGELLLFLEEKVQLSSFDSDVVIPFRRKL